MACHPRATYHIAACRVLPLGEFTVTIPEPHATLQGAVTWRNQCHDRATLQGVIIPPAILKIVFCHILLFLLQLALTSAAAFVRLRLSDTLVINIVMRPSPILRVTPRPWCFMKS